MRRLNLDQLQTLVAVADLGTLAAAAQADCAAAREALDAHLRHVRARLAELRALERDLRSLRDRCDGRDDHCHIIEALHARADQPVPAPGRASKPTVGKAAATPAR